MDINKRYIIQNFVIHIYKELLKGEDMPSLKFIFKEDAFDLFKEVQNNPVPIEGVFYEKIADYMIQYIKDNNHINSGELYINIDNANLFFDKLTYLIELYTKLEEDYDGFTNFSYLAKEYLKIGLWLRMTPEDFNNIYGFIDRQISFLENGFIFDDLYKDGSIRRKHLEDDYLNYKVASCIDINTLWYETYQKMIYELIDLDTGASYELPSIHFGIADENNKKVCYIYGIQNKDGEHDKKIERSLYKLNAGIEEPNIHPSFVLALKLFIDFLNKRGINDIKVPLLEVFNYDYHVKMSDKEKDRFSSNWPDEYVKEITIQNDTQELDNYEEDKKIASRIIDREDFISKAKVENLANLVIRVQEQFDNIDYEVEPYMLKVRIKEKIEENVK